MSFSTMIGSKKDGESKMIRKLLIALAAFLLVGACAFGAGALVEPDTAVRPITAESPCPAVGCASGECHGFDDVPLPDGAHEMDCPEATCSDVECHAWETLLDGYRQADDASLNVWVLAPVAFVVGLVAMVRALSKPGRRTGAEAATSAEGPEGEEE